MESISRVWKAGGGILVITIGKNIREYYGVKEGDWVRVSLEKTEKNTPTRRIREKMAKTEVKTEDKKRTIK